MSFASLSVVFLMLIRKKLLGEFPLFTVYIVVQLVGWTAMMWVVPHFSRDVSWYGWFVMQCLDIILSSAVVLEVFAVLLRPYAGIRKLGLLVCMCAGIVLSIAAAWMAFTTPPSEVSYAHTTVRVIALQRSADFARLALLLVFFMFSRIFGLNWRHFLLGIAIGSGAMALVDVLAESMRLQFGYGSSNLLGILAPMGYVLGTLVWAVFMVRKESTLVITETPQTAILLRWNHALEELLGPIRTVTK